MEITVTAKVKIMPNKEDEKRLMETFRAYRSACNYISGIVFNEKTTSVGKLHPLTYRNARSIYGLKSQMSQSALRTVISKYKTNKSNGHKWTRVLFKKPQYDLVYGRDYSLLKGVFSVNTLSGDRAKVPFEAKAMEQYFDGSWTFGTAKLVFKHGKWFLHIPMSKELDDVNVSDIDQVVGIDMGINFVATAYDSKGERAPSLMAGILSTKEPNINSLEKSFNKKVHLQQEEGLKPLGSEKTVGWLM